MQGGKENRKEGIALKRKTTHHAQYTYLRQPKKPVVHQLLLFLFWKEILYHKTENRQVTPTEDDRMGMGMKQVGIVKVHRIQISAP